MLKKYCNKIVLGAITFSVICFASCNKKDSSNQFSYLNDFQGEFVEYNNPETSYFAYQDWNFNVIEDSVAIKITFHTDVINPYDSCSTSSWNEYVVGNISQEESNLIIFGNYTDSNYKLKTEGCYNIGEFEAKFKAKLENEFVKFNRIVDGYTVETIYLNKVE